MGRPRTKNFDLPPKVARKGAVYYFVTLDGGCRLWIRLGEDREIAFSTADTLRRQYRRDPQDPKMREHVMQRDGFACVYCGAVNGLEVDHVVPLSRGGANTMQNIVVACRSCNATKNATHPAIFVGNLQNSDHLPVTNQ